MSRPVPLDHSFDKDKFTEILNDIRGECSQSVYAKECGLSVAYVCKYLNGYFKTPPNPNTVFKFAKGVDDETLSELLYVAGYDPEKYLCRYEHKIISQYKKPDIEDIIKSSMFDYLSESVKNNYSDHDIAVIQRAFSGLSEMIMGRVKNR